MLTGESVIRSGNAPGGAGSADPAPEEFFVIRPGSFYAGDPRVKAYDGGGYVQDSYPVPRPVYDALLSALDAELGAPPHADDGRLVAHLWLVGALRHADEDGGFVPLPWQVLARHVPDADPDALVRRGALSYVPPVSKKRCAEFAVSEHVAEALDAALASSLFEGPYVNLFTGRPVQGRRSRSQKYDKNRNPHPPAVTAAMDAVPLGIVNLPSLRAHLDRLLTAVGKAETAEDRERARARWRNDANCTAWIRSRGLTKTDVPGVYMYPHAWRMQGTGRIMPLQSGGAQGLSREGKRAAYAGIAGVYNYDLRSSQPRILKAELDALGIPCDWLAAYLADPRAKYACADRVGGSVDVWKGAFMAAVTGGVSGVPKTFRTRRAVRYVRGERVETERPVCAAMRALEAEVGREAAPEVWARVRAELDDLLGAVRTWHRHLKAWADENATDGRGGRYLKNAVGARLKLDKLTARELPRKVAAHVLQGREALYVHALCTLGARYGFRVVSHEHDGVVTLGDVPREAKDEASRLAEMPYAELEPKAFAPDTAPLRLHRSGDAPVRRAA